jgi:large-conductance mechanosensitive channel
MEKLKENFSKLLVASAIAALYGWIFDLWTLKDKVLGQMTFGEFIGAITGLIIIGFYVFRVFAED